MDNVHVAAHTWNVDADPAAFAHMLVHALLQLRDSGELDRLKSAIDYRPRGDASEAA